MDNEILEQLQNISKQLEKVVKLMEDSAAASAKREAFSPRKSFDNKRSFGDKKGFGDRKSFGKKEFFSRKQRFDDNGKPRLVADGRGYDRRGKRF